MTKLYSLQQMHLLENNINKFNADIKAELIQDKLTLKIIWIAEYR